MGDLSEHFSKKEFACKCGCGRNVTNMDVVNGCQDVRDVIGIPITVNSGTRCEKRNAAAGGVPNSFHVQGSAVDIACSKGAQFLFLTIINMCDQGKFRKKPDYVIWYKKKNFVHMDWGKPRNNRFAVSE